MTESPSSLLERAAAKLEHLASEATPGPWWGHVIRGDVYSGEEEFGEGHLVATARDEEDGEWIATMSPSVASPLVEWLRKTAAHFAGMDEVHPLPPEVLAQSPGQYGYEAVRFARIVLGEPE